MNSAALIGEAMALHREGRLDEAERIYIRILDTEPENADALHLHGVIRHQKKDHAYAEDLYRRAIRTQPLFARAWSNLGMLMQETNRWDEAIACFRKVVSIEPSSGPSWNALGISLARTGDLAGAELAYRNAIDNGSASAEVYNNLGTVLARRGDRQGAKAVLERALRERPDYTSPQVNLGRLLREEGRLDEAAAIYRKALSCDPNSAPAHWGLAHVLLLKGDLAAGWREYEWRWALDEHPDAPDRPEPLWRGELCDGKHIIVFAEQGLGDAVQFVRYASLLALRGARVTLLVPQTLARLFREVPGIDAVESSFSPGLAADFRCPLLSLPGILGTTLTTIPAQVPPLQPPESVRQLWRERCALDPPGLKVGIAWAGSSTHLNDSQRSIDPHLFARLAGIEGVQIHSLQVDDPLRRKIAREVIPGIIDRSGLLHDVADTAGLIAGLDLVITVDSLVAHLAGAMGKPVWILLPSAPDWRWLLGRTDSPWYPTARLFRQSHEGNWEEVMTRVEEALETELRNRAGGSRETQRENSVLAEGLALHERGSVDEAERVYRAVLRNEPDNREARYLLAVSRYQQGDYSEAIGHSRHLTNAHPFFPEAYNVLGNSLRKNGDLIGAEDILRKAIALRPDEADAHYNLGGCLCDAWRLEEAAEEFLAALRLNPAFPQALNNLGLVRYRQGNRAEAIQYYRAALARQLDQTEAHWNLAHALLHDGKYAEGWREFEWRWQMPAFQQLAARYDRPRWNGEALGGKRLLVWCEQGFGDAMQFSRTLSGLKDRGGEILLECHQALVPLLGHLNGIRVIGRTDVIPDHDMQVPLLSLPAILGWTDIPATIFPYLYPDAGACARWEEELRVSGDRMRVGIVWSGSKTNPEGRFRSIPLDALSALARTTDVFFVSLQTHEGADEFVRSPLAASGRDWTDRLTDFGETAALIGQLDLVITIDTAVAHVAGALGVPAWVLLAAACDWRWGVMQHTTSWYPSVRLYRQQQQGRWNEVVEAVDRDLSLLAAHVRVPGTLRRDPVIRARLRDFDPSSFASWNNIGVALLESGRPREAIPPLQQATRLDPDNPRGHLNLAFAQLADGQWNEGLENHEWRLRTEEGSSSLRPYQQPRWSGQPLRGKNLFLYAEQGFGDAIQYIRYAWPLAQSGARVTVEVRPELHRLFRHAPGVSTVICRGDEPPAFDYHSPLLSLAYAFRTTPATVPARTPYLIAGHEQLVLWKKRLDAAGSALRIGLCWSGNPRYIADRERSVTAGTLSEILPPGDLLVLPLVKDEPVLQRPGNLTAAQWCDLTASIEDFADTAALVTYLDLVITVDTAVAHLAGALGKPVFMLTPWAADWRWLSNAHTTPWYPTMRLFRQSRRGSWEEPLDALGAAVRQFLQDLADRSLRADMEQEDTDA